MNEEMKNYVSQKVKSSILKEQHERRSECYLGDVIGKGGGAEEASRARVGCAWGKFRDLRMLLTARGASLRVKGKIYRTCVQRGLVYGSETWPMKKDDIQRLVRTENSMVRWMSGVTRRTEDRVSSSGLGMVLRVWRKLLGVAG